ncbi:hypothetical protein [Microseira wollei]|uniref:hypothetical protein n=1 Tax=Microseira wollei TaxID=467598 RepID=UPI001CFDE0EA|nr:hypothetical protein [Microseira wollei]
MTQSGGNGHKSEVQPEEIRIFEPAYLPDQNSETDEPIGYVEIGLTEDEDEGEFTPELPPELRDDESEQPPN